MQKNNIMSDLQFQKELDEARERAKKENDPLILWEFLAWRAYNSEKMYCVQRQQCEDKFEAMDTKIKRIAGGIGTVSAGIGAGIVATVNWMMGR